MRHAWAQVCAQWQICYDTPMSLLRVTAQRCKSSPMRSSDEGDDLITTAQAAAILNYTVAWVNKMAATGRLPVAQKLPGRTGAYLFRRSEIESARTGVAA